MKNSLLAAGKTHPASWWLLGLSFAIAASLSTSWVTLLWLAICSMLFVLAFREQAPWAKSIRFYVQLALAVIFIRVLFRIIFNLESTPLNPVLVLPEINIDLGFGSTLHLLGSMSSLSLQSAFTDGLRLASIILAIGMANSLANPRKLLKSTPGALYEIATAISIAINLAPQLISSLNRVRKARELRGQSKGMRGLPGIVIPVLEDTIDQSMALAASMSARGFGRQGSRTKTNQVLVRTLGLSGITALTVGVFLLLISPATQILDLTLVVVGVILTSLYIHLSSAGSLRTRYRKEPWRFGDFLLLTITAAVLYASFSGVLSL